MSQFKAILLAVALCLGAGALSRGIAAPVNTGHVQLELVPEAPSIAPGSSLHVALRQKIAPGWHTYWRNPGDAGEPPKVVWTLPPGWQVGEPVWPTPHRLKVGPLMDYGFEGQVLLPIPITAPVRAPVGRPVQLKAAVSVLVCKEICIPEDGVLSLSLPVANASGRPDPEVAKALADAPKAQGLDAAMSFAGGRLKIAVAGAPLRGTRGAGAYFFPYDSTVIDHARPQAVERGPSGLTLTLAPGYAFKKGTPPKRLKGVLTVGGAAYEIDARQGAAPAGAAGLGPVAEESGAGGGMTLPAAIAFAFIGGMILNLMPCVFPVLAMKAAALAGHGEAPNRARIEGLAYAAGVVATFLALAGGLIAAKAGGQAIGWGYQLQSPVVVAGLALLMLLVALNLSGLFEVGTSAQGAGAGLAARGGAAGAFFTGALAVVVAAPCTAPFMAAAIGYALGQPAAVTLAIFLALGLGLALPFTALSFVPALLRRLPRPGAWMDVLRRGLAFPMYGAAAWLAWVFASQAGDLGLARLLAAALVVAFGGWLYGLGQAGGGRTRALQLAALPAVAVAAVLIYPTATAPPATAAATPAASSAASLPVTAYSQARLAELRGQGKTVFVDFTADWCITCKVNEKTALSTAAVSQAFATTGAVYMVADWTSRNDEIARELQAHGRAGVPLYLVYGAKGGDPVILPQLLTEGAVVAALKDAAAS